MVAVNYFTILVKLNIQIAVKQLSDLWLTHEMISVNDWFTEIKLNTKEIK